MIKKNIDETGAEDEKNVCCRYRRQKKKEFWLIIFLGGGSSRFVLSWRSEQDRRRVATTTRSTFIWHPLLSSSCSPFPFSLSLSFAHARARRLIKPSIAQLPCCVVMSLAAKQQRASRSCMMLGKLEMLSFLSLWRCRVTTNHITQLLLLRRGPIRGRCQLLT
jgi:hypothetical protein